MPKPRSASFNHLPHLLRRLEMAAVLLIMLSLIGNSLAIAGAVSPQLPVGGDGVTLCADGHTVAMPAEDAPDSHDCNDACCILCLSALMVMEGPAGPPQPFAAAIAIARPQIAAPLFPLRIQGQPGKPRAPPVI